MSGKTVLIGLDGATFSVLDPLLARGVMPFLRDFLAEGVRARLRSVIPPLTPPAWTSLMTGKRPGEHGVFDFFQKDTPDDRHVRLTSSADVRSETIWTLASAAGLRVTALNFPQTFPPPPVDGCVVPGGWMPWRQLRLGCRPADLFDRLKALPSFNARELALDMALEEKALEGCAADEYAEWVALHCRRERRWFDVLDYLMREEPADLTAILFDGVDKLQHLCWRFLDPSCGGARTPWEQQMAECCEEYFRQLDGLLAAIAERAGPDATLVLASDHGFGPSRDIFYVNTWLEQEGYLAWSADAPAAGDSNKVGIGHLARHTFELDWDRTVAYAATPSSQGIHLVHHDAGAARVRAELAERLRGLRHPETGGPVVADIWTREEAFAGPYEELGPDLTILLEGNGVVSIMRCDTVIKRRPEPVGTHHPVGVFMARGPGIRAGAALPELSILDVAPLLLETLGVPRPDDLSGRLPAAVFASGTAGPRAARAAAQALAPIPATVPAGDDGYDADEEAVVLKRLKALGYVD